MDVFTELPISSELQLKILWWRLDEKDTFFSKGLDSLKLKLLLNRVIFHGLERTCICPEQSKLKSQTELEKNFNLAFSHRYVCNHKLLAAFSMLSQVNLKFLHSSNYFAFTIKNFLRYLSIKSPFQSFFLKSFLLAKPIIYLRMGYQLISCAPGLARWPILPLWKQSFESSYFPIFIAA